MCAGACVSFMSRTQKCMTVSSTEAEYVAMAEGFREAIFLRYIWIFIFPDMDISEGMRGQRRDNPLGEEPGKDE